MGKFHYGYTIKNGKSYILLTINDYIVFKIVDNLIQDEGMLRLYSLNTLYKPCDVHFADIKEVWSFVNLISNETPIVNSSNENLSQKVFDLTREVGSIKSLIRKGND